MERTDARRAILYVRVSEDKQHGRSVEEQEADCRADCERNGWTVAEVVADNDVGASRWSKGTRAGYQRLSAILSAGDVLVTWEASRAQRDLDAYLGLRNLCAERGVLWRYSGRTYDLSQGDDRFSTGLDALLAEKASEETRARVARAARHNAQKGLPHFGGRIAFGYRKTDGPTVIEPDPVTAPLVVEAARRVIEGESLQSIARFWTESGALQGNGSPWQGGHVGRVLQNPVYIGKRRHNGQVVAQGVWPPILDDDTFRRLVGILSNPNRRTQRGNVPVHLLSGIAKCAVCHEPMGWHDNRRTHPQYRCARAGHVSVREDWLDDYIERAQVLPYLDNIAADRFIFFDPTEGSEGAQEHRNAADELQQRLDEFIDQAIAGDLSAATLAKIEADLAPKIEHHREQEQALMAGADPLLNALVTDPVGFWKAGDLKARRAFIRAAFDIEVSPPGRGVRTFKPETVAIERRRKAAPSLTAWPTPSAPPK